jgi:delta(3,5)-delta(2,4)-dienoyl-CoA isomerase
MWHELRSLVDAFSCDPDIRVVIFSGAGPRAFSAGLDVQAASQGTLGGKKTESDAARVATRLRRHVGEFQDCVTALEKCEKPIIIVLHGISYGLSVDLATACDIRFCTKDVRFSVKEVDIGLAADVGTLTRLPKVVGNYGWVKEVCMSAREFGADEAHRVGFVNNVYATKEDGFKGAVDLATLIASKSPVAVQGTKELLNFSRDHNVPDGLRYTGVWNSASLQTKDVQDALLSGIQKRKPTFEKL